MNNIEKSHNGKGSFKKYYKNPDTSDIYMPANNKKYFNQQQNQQKFLNLF